MLSSGSIVREEIARANVNFTEVSEAWGGSRWQEDLGVRGAR